LLNARTRVDEIADAARNRTELSFAGTRTTRFWRSSCTGGSYITQLVQSVKHLLLSLGTRVGYSRRGEVEAGFYVPASHHSEPKKQRSSRCSLDALKLRPYTLSGVGWRARRSMLVAIRVTAKGVAS